MPSKTKNIVRPQPNYQSLENRINILDLENLGLGATGVKSKGKYKQVPRPVPSGIEVSKKSTATIKVAKRKSIEDCVDDGPGPVSISINHLYLLICSSLSATKRLSRSPWCVALLLPSLIYYY